MAWKRDSSVRHCCSLVMSKVINETIAYLSSTLHFSNNGYTMFSKTGMSIMMRMGFRACIWSGFKRPSCPWKHWSVKSVTGWEEEVPFKRRVPRRKCERMAFFNNCKSSSWKLESRSKTQKCAQCVHTRSPSMCRACNVHLDPCKAEHKYTSMSDCPHVCFFLEGGFCCTPSLWIVWWLQTCWSKRAQKTGSGKKSSITCNTDFTSSINFGCKPTKAREHRSVVRVLRNQNATRCQNKNNSPQTCHRHDRANVPVFLLSTCTSLLMHAEIYPENWKHWIPPKETSVHPAARKVFRCRNRVYSHKYTSTSCWRHFPWAGRFCIFSCRSQTQLKDKKIGPGTLRWFTWIIAHRIIRAIENK